MNYLIIGAGPCGLAMARAMQQAGIGYEQVEADDGVGGNWRHGVYDTVYTDACKDVMQFPEYPMPASWPDFLSGKQMLRYLEQYALTYDLNATIRLRTKVVWIAALDNNLWQAWFDDGSIGIYKGMIICNGHHWDMNHPVLPGNFEGTYLHAKQYRNPEQLHNRRVVVMGSGNSAADIVCEAARVGNSAVLSMRDSPWIFPKTFMGVPLGRSRFRNAPAFLMPLLIRVLLQISFGKHTDYGLPAPRHAPLEKHPTVSEELPYYLKHGRVLICPEISKVQGKHIWFTNGSCMEADVLIAATGYNLSFPFLPASLTRVSGKTLKCIGHCVYPDYMGLFFMGWQQVRGGIGSLAAVFASAIVQLIKIEAEFGIPVGSVLTHMGESIATTHLYPAQNIFEWVNTHTFAKLTSMAKAMSQSAAPVNKPTEAPAATALKEKLTCY